MRVVTVKAKPIITGTNGNKLFNCKCSFHKAITRCVSGTGHDLRQWAVRCLSVVTFIIFIIVIIPKIPSI